MLEYLSLQGELDRDDVASSDKRTIVGIIDRMERDGYLSAVEAVSFHLVRERVMRALQAGYLSGRGHRAA